VRAHVGRVQCPPVVHEVVEVIALLVGHGDALDELDHTAADVARDDDAERKAVVRGEPLAVLLVGQDDVVGRIHGPEHADARSVDALVALGKLVLGPVEPDVLVVGDAIGRDAAQLEDVPEADAGPRRARRSVGPPGEPDRLLVHVLLLAPVSGTGERTRHVDGRERHDVVHGEHLGLRVESAHRQAMGLPVLARHGAVVADVVIARGGDVGL